MGAAGVEGEGCVVVWRHQRGVTRGLGDHNKEIGHEPGGGRFRSYQDVGCLCLLMLDASKPVKCQWGVKAAVVATRVVDRVDGSRLVQDADEKRAHL